MAEKIIRVRHRSKIRALLGVATVPLWRRRVSPSRVALAIGAGVVAITLGGILFVYGARFYNGWRETRLLERAASLLQQEKFAEAAQTARRILNLHPDSLPALSIVAEAAEKRNLEEAVSWRAQIARILPHDLESQLNLASAALRFGQLDTARKALDNVLPTDRDAGAFHVVAGWLARAQGNFAEQEAQFAAALKKEPGNELYQFNLAALEIRSSDEEKNARAHRSLERLSKSPQFRTGALRALLNDAVEHDDFAGADNWAQQLQMSPQITFSDYLLCLNFYRKLDEKKFAAVLAKVKPFATRNRLDLALLMEWMNANGLAADTLKWLDRLPSEIITQPPPALAVAEAFAETKNWSRLRRWTRTGSWGDDDYLRLAYQALSARHSRQSTADAEFSSLWSAAERAANDLPDREVKLARFASRWNLSVEAEQLWSRLSTNPPTRREALDALYRIYRENNELKNLQDILQRLHQSSPNEPAITANLARLELNLGQNTLEAQKFAKEAYDRAPDDVNCAVTYAFSLYTLNRTAEGVEIIKKRPQQSYDSHAAVYVALLLLDQNQTEAARSYIETADHGPLYSEEKKLLGEIKVKISQPSSSPLPSPSRSAPELAPTPASTATPE